MCTLDCPPPVRLVIGQLVSIQIPGGDRAQRETARVRDVANGGAIGYLETITGSRAAWFVVRLTRKVPRPLAAVEQPRSEIIEPRWSGSEVSR